MSIEVNFLASSRIHRHPDATKKEDLTTESNGTLLIHLHHFPLICLFTQHERSFERSQKGAIFLGILAAKLAHREASAGDFQVTNLNGFGRLNVSLIKAHVSSRRGPGAKWVSSSWPSLLDVKRRDLLVKRSFSVYTSRVFRKNCWLRRGILWNVWIAIAFVAPCL